MVKNFVALPDEAIRQKSKEVTSFDKSVKDAITDLIETAEVQTDPPALGLAAPQIGVFKRIFVAKIRGKFRPFINTKILKTSKSEGAFLEGCFSVPKVYGNAIRPLEIAIESKDAQGKKIKKKYKGLAARIIQHEIDHLNGTLFIDHVENQNGKFFNVEKDKKGKEILVEIEKE
ncbi:MAG: peptide deformylase [Candidatus Curtissbacteria bacterium]|nr:peptide deformylase [Candidatus Curtissbacteria bacterium]